MTLAHPAKTQPGVSAMRGSLRPIALAFLFLSLVTGHSSLLTLSLTNQFGLPDTNAIRVVQASTNTPVLADGSVVTIGLPVRVNPDTNGTVRIFRLIGNYVLYGPTLGRGLVYRFPDNYSNATAYPLSGFNTFETVTVLGITTNTIIVTNFSYTYSTNFINQTNFAYVTNFYYTTNLTYVTNTAGLSGLTNNQTGVTLAGVFTGSLVGNADTATTASTAYNALDGNPSASLIQAQTYAQVAAQQATNPLSGGAYKNIFTFVPTNQPPGFLLTNLVTMTVIYGTNDALRAAQLAAAGVVTNDPNVQAFIANAGITDSKAIAGISGFVADLKASGRFVWLNDLKIFGAGYNPTSNVSFYGKPWTMVNPVYSPFGLVQMGTNFASGPLATTISAGQPHSELFIHRNTDFYMGRLCESAGSNPKYYIQYALYGGVANSNTAAGVFLSRMIQGGVAAWEHYGPKTNWGATSAAWTDISTTPNGFRVPDCNGFNSARRGAGDLRIDVLTSDANNVHKFWNGSLPGQVPVNSGITYTSAVVCLDPITTFQIGTNADWQYWRSNLDHAVLPAGGGGDVVYSGNSQGVETFAVASFKTNMDAAFVSDVTRATLRLFPQDTIHINTGTSMMNPANSGGNGTTFTWTNSIGFIRHQFYPNDLWVEYASPGSTLAIMTNLPVAVVGSAIFPSTFFSNCVMAGKKVIVRGDDGRNDITAAAGGWLAASNNWKIIFTSFANAITANGGNWEYRYIGTPLMVDSTGLNTNLWIYGTTMRNNPLVSKGVGGYSFPMGVLSTNDVKQMSYGTAHLDNETNGYPFLVQEMWALEGANDGLTFYNPTNPAVVWKYGGNVQPAGDNVNLIIQTNFTATGPWGTLK